MGMAGFDSRRPTKHITNKNRIHETYNQRIIPCQFQGINNQHFVLDEHAYIGNERNW